MSRETVYGLVGLLVGGGIGALIAWKYLQSYYAEIALEEIAEMKAHYEAQAKKQKTGKWAKLDDLAAEVRRQEEREAYLKGLRQLGYDSEEAADADPKFDKAAWLNEVVFHPTDEEAEDEGGVDTSRHYTQKDRDTSKPYVISYEEFAEEHDEFSKTTITYYEGDDTLCDEREEPIPDFAYYVGDDALTRFGDMSHDKNVVYVRNENISIDFEVVRDQGLYSRVVLGMEPPEKKPKVRKMKAEE